VQKKGDGADISGTGKRYLYEKPVLKPQEGFPRPDAGATPGRGEWKRRNSKNQMKTKGVRCPDCFHSTVSGDWFGRLGLHRRGLQLEKKKETTWIQKFNEATHGAPGE